MARRDALQLVFAADQAYAPGLQVALASALLWSPPERPVQLHILDGGLRSSTWRRLQHLVQRLHPLGRLVRHPMAGSPIHSIRDRGGIGRLAYARLHIPELIEAPRALYLDVDLLLLADPTPLFDQPLGTHWAAAVADPHFATLSTDSPFQATLSPAEAAGPYFNSGVLLLDLEACRRERISERAFALLESHGPVCRYHDQTVLNHLLRGHWLALPERWNCLSKRLLWSPERGLSPQPIPAVLHYYAVVKPWISAREPYPAHRLWHHFARDCAGLPPLRSYNRLVLRQLLIENLRCILSPYRIKERQALKSLLPQVS